MRKEELKKIHESSICGQKIQMVEQIKEYGEYVFFSDYKKFLDSNVGYWDETKFKWFADCVISYHRITNR
jgi:hypothetical protein